MIAAEIQHVTQPTALTCGHACVAALTGTDVALIVNRLGEQPMDDRALIAELARHRIGAAIMREAWSPIHVLVVPSRTLYGGLHYVVSDERRGDEFLMDPNPSAMDRWTADQIVSMGFAYAISVFDSETPLATEP